MDYTYLPQAAAVAQFDSSAVGGSTSVGSTGENQILCNNFELFWIVFMLNQNKLITASVLAAEVYTRL